MLFSPPDLLFWICPMTAENTCLLISWINLLGHVGMAVKGHESSAPLEQAGPNTRNYRSKCHTRPCRYFSKSHPGTKPGTHWCPEAVLPCSQQHQNATGQLTWNYSLVRQTLLKQRCQMTVGSHTQLWSSVPACTGNSCSGIHEGTSNMVLLETANTHTLVVSKSTHILAVVLY